MPGIATAVDEVKGNSDGHGRPAPATALPRQRLRMDEGWMFHLGHGNDPRRDFGFGEEKRDQTFSKTGLGIAPARLDFKPTGWQTIRLPHDWAIDLPFVDEMPLFEHGGQPLGREHPETSIGWYRRFFHLPEAARGQRVVLEFDGVMSQAMIAVNGIVAARSQTGYTPVQIDITDLVDVGRDNVVAVRVSAALQEGWFYEGAGIYRHAWLNLLPPLHLALWGTAIRAKGQGGGATIEITAEVCNDSDSERRCRLRVGIHDADDREVALLQSDPVTLAAGARATLSARGRMATARRWRVDDPQLHTATVVLSADETVCDTQRIPFGVRDVVFTPDRGLFINGESVKLQGTCNHQDHAGVGAALPDALQRYRIGRLKAMGCNAYRSAHNPPTPELVDACDALGMLVMCETRMFSSSEEGKRQLEAMVRRFRNNPSVILWSLGNEEPEQGTARGAAMGASLATLLKRLDPTRPITFGMDGKWGQGVATVLDVQGFNYNTQRIDAFHAAHPQVPVIGSETSSATGTRGIYVNDEAKGYVDAYNTTIVNWGETAQSFWSFYGARDWLAGGFVWTGFDYRGEPSPKNRWPAVASHFGIMDSCGFAKDVFHYYRAWWQPQPVLHLFPHWDWPLGTGEVEVRAYSNLDEVELLMNGRSLGRKPVPTFGHVAWRVAYAVGAIEARGYRDGKQVMVERRETTGKPIALRLTADRTQLAADGDDVAVVQVEALDARGRSVPIADDLIRFSVQGSGRLLGTGNGDPASHESDRTPQRRLFNGLAMALLQAGTQPGRLLLRAEAAGMRPATIECTLVATRAQSRVAIVERSDA